MEFALRAASNYVSYFKETGLWLRDAITLLCEISTLEEPRLARAGSEGLFGHLVEMLNDSFEPNYCDLYDRAFSQVIEFCRRRPKGYGFDLALNRCGLLQEQDFPERRARLRRQCERSWSGLAHVKKIFLLSRVTVGADIAVTSVILSALSRALPLAELTLVASAKLKQLYGGDSKLQLRELPYPRGGGLWARLDCWLQLVALVERESKGLAPDELRIVDPDSRLTQLGLLPVTHIESQYAFFESRRYRAPGRERLGQLTAAWIAGILGTMQEEGQFLGPIYPYVAIPRDIRNVGREVCERLYRGGAPFLVSVSLGVGGNQRKRLPNEFEERLIRLLMENSVIILDQGENDQERQQIDWIATRMRAEGKKIVQADERTVASLLAMDSISADLLTWKGGLGSLGALIAESDEYVGYDSAGQHIAAALGVPTLVLFVNTGSELFLRRWSPYGPCAIEIIEIYPDRLRQGQDNLERIFEQAAAGHRRLRH
jgi:ADP-heptose:LPS heptosyltransferase